MTQAKRARSDTRRIPRQKRSLQAVEAIFEATARLVESRGSDWTTTHIAELAGYGIGTIYDYFPDKNAILIAMARQELDEVARSVRKALEQVADEDATAMQKTMRALIRGFGGRRRLRGVLLATMIAEGHASELNAPIETIIEFLRQQNRETGLENMASLLPEQLYVLTRAIVGTIRAWAMDEGDRISPQVLETELAELVQGYLAHHLNNP